MLCVKDIPIFVLVFEIQRNICIAILFLCEILYLVTNTNQYWCTLNYIFLNTEQNVYCICFSFSRKGKKKDHNRTRLFLLSSVTLKLQNLIVYYIFFYFGAIYINYTKTYGLNFILFISVCVINMNMLVCVVARECRMYIKTFKLWTPLLSK